MKETHIQHEHKKRRETTFWWITTAWNSHTKSMFYTFCWGNIFPVDRNDRLELLLNQFGFYTCICVSVYVCVRLLIIFFASSSGPRRLHNKTSSVFSKNRCVAHLNSKSLASKGCLKISSHFFCCHSCLIFRLCMHTNKIQWNV